MNRRSVLRFLMVAGVVGPGVITQSFAANAAVPAISPWIVTQWWERKFDRANKIGFAIEITNQETGESFRNAVRLLLTPEMRYAKSRVIARRILRTWAEEFTGQAIVWPRS